MSEWHLRPAPVGAYMGAAGNCNEEVLLERISPRLRDVRSVGRTEATFGVGREDAFVAAAPRHEHDAERVCY
jgi:hypothetical protein